MSVTSEHPTPWSWELEDVLRDVPIRRWIVRDAFKHVVCELADDRGDSARRIVAAVNFREGLLDYLESIGEVTRKESS